MNGDLHSHIATGMDDVVWRIAENYTAPWIEVLVHLDLDAEGINYYTNVSWGLWEWGDMEDDYFCDKKSLYYFEMTFAAGGELWK